MTKTHWVGIDVSAVTIDVAIWNERNKQSDYQGEFQNNEAGFAKLKACLEKVKVDNGITVVVEATGGYELGLLAHAYQQNWSVALPNPKQVRDFAKATGRRNKTDQEDAALLAQFGAERQPEAQGELPLELQELDELLQRRIQLEKQRRGEKARLKQWQQRPHPSASVTDSLERTIEHLDSELAQIEQALKQWVNDHPQHKEMVTRLRTAPGIGVKNVLPVLLILHRFNVRTNGNGSAKALTAYVGLDPTHFTSGTTVHKRSTISKMGDGMVRSLLYMGALGGIRGDNPLRHFYQRLVNRGKSKRLALVAAARKILIWCHALFTRQVDFDATLYKIPSSTA